MVHILLYGICQIPVVCHLWLTLVDCVLLTGKLSDCYKDVCTFSSQGNIVTANLDFSDVLKPGLGLDKLYFTFLRLCQYCRADKPCRTCH